MIKTPVWNIGGGIRHGHNLINYFIAINLFNQLNLLIENNFMIQLISFLIMFMILFLD